MVSQWIRINNVNTMQWPVYSPDMNIIENCWGHLVRMTYGNGRQFHSRQELMQCLQNKWKEIHHEYIQELFKSMPDRIFQLIHKNGYKTDYIFVLYFIIKFSGFIRVKQRFFCFSCFILEQLIVYEFFLKFILYTFIV